MKPAPFDYVAPESIEEACAVLAEAGGGATILAGGQTLMPLLALRMSQPFILVDLGRVAALRGVTRAVGATRIGPMLRQSDAITDATIASHLPVLATVVAHIGHHQTRNRGTVGGSIAFGEPAAELPAMAVALDASLEVCSVRGTRRIGAGQFYLGPYATALEPEEIVTGIEIPDWDEGTIPIFRELARRPGDFALIGLVGTVTVAEGKVARARLAWFGMGPTPMRALRAEAALAGADLAGLDVRGIADLAVADTDPFDDHHTSAEYRRTVGRSLFARTLGEALALKAAA
ncbi:xanthine dehydrogenase family protein subunit M [Sphingomonas oligophenolica]|uniref:FAD binding domain-containing protein n=1 Tax=Sphingomonas oligophenolica TaxID=301154 RepID=A0ABU9Y7Q8_9SPHN